MKKWLDLVPSYGTDQSCHPAPLTEHGRSPHPHVLYPPSRQHHRPVAAAQTPMHPP